MIKNNRLLIFFSILFATSAAAQLPESLEYQDSAGWERPLSELVMTRLGSLVDDTLTERSQVGMMVWDLTADSLLYAYHPQYLLRTASTMKLLTAITALDCLGTAYDYKTSFYYKGTIEHGQLRGDLICVGGMDPMFSSKDMKAFVEALKSRGVTSLRGRIVCDNTMKDADKWGSGWCWDDDNPTLTPLLVNRKANFSAELLKELKAARITTAGTTVVSGTLPQGAIALCTRTHSIDEVLNRMMKESDNLYAEATYYQVAASTGRRPATAKDAREVELALFEKIGLDGSRYRLADGSGLSLYDYLTPEAQTMLLRYVWQQRDLYDHLLPTLPIAGTDGTLEKRMRGTWAEGNVRAKTGTVTAVSGLSGYCTAANGHQLCFCIINQGIRQASEGRAFQDRVCEALCRP